MLLAFAIALGACGVALWIQNNVPEPHVMRTFDRFAGYGPLALGAHSGIALIVAAILGMLFVPSLRVEDKGVLGYVILGIEAVAGVSILLGAATRAGAVILALLGIVAMQPLSIGSILE